MGHATLGNSLDRLGNLIGARPAITYLRLPSADRRLLREALVAVALVRAALWMMPLKRLHLRLMRCRASKPGPPHEPARIGWAVAAAAGRVPSATCLTRALALQVLLRRRGLRSSLHVGFRLLGDDEVCGHAWLECGGEVLSGGGGLDDFRSLLRLDG
jgi:hypothetical protein